MGLHIVGIRYFTLFNYFFDLNALDGCETVRGPLLLPRLADDYESSCLCSLAINESFLYT